MINKWVRILVVVVTASSFSAASADRPAVPLFGALSEADRLTAERLNPYFIGKYTSSAGRYRIVRVNSDILGDAERIAIFLFDGEVLELQKTRTIETPAIGGLRWEGVPGMGLPTVEDYQALAGPLSNRALAESVRDAQFTVKLSSALYWRDRESEANLGSVSLFFPDSEPIGKDRMSLRTNDPNFLVGVSARFSNPRTGARYGLELLGMGGPYHVLWEEDPERRRVVSDVLFVLDSDGRLVAADQSSEDTAGQPVGDGSRQKQDADDLGVNPHDEIYGRLLSSNTEGK